MDKETLSNYGWVVIVVIVLAIMIALASPFGGYIKNGVEDILEKFDNTLGEYSTGNSFDDNNESDVLSLKFDEDGTSPFTFAITNEFATPTTVILSNNDDVHIAEMANQNEVSGNVQISGTALISGIVNGANLTSVEMPSLYKNNGKYYAITMIEEPVYNAIVENTESLINAPIFPNAAEELTGTERNFANLSWGDALDSLSNSTKITTVVLTTGSLMIYDEMFNGCVNLSSVTLPSSIEFIGVSAFAGCSSLTSIIIPNSVVQIGTSAFNGTGLTSVVIPNGVAYVDEYAFANCSQLTSVTIPSSVIYIGVAEIFTGCISLANINVAGDNEYYKSIDGVLFSKDGTTLIYYPYAKTGSYVIPEGVTTIGVYAFSGHANVTAIAFMTKNRLEYYGHDAEALSVTIILPDSLTTIESCAFQGCTGLTIAEFPNDDYTIGDHAFYNCTNLNTLYNYIYATSIGTGAFNNTSVNLE